MVWRLKKVGVYAKVCPEEARAIRTNKDRFWEVWFQEFPNFDFTKDRYGKRVLVIYEDGTEHLRESVERGDSYEVWAPVSLDDWKVCIAYNKWASVSERLRRDSRFLEPRYGREFGVVVVYHKPSVSREVFDILSG